MRVGYLHPMPTHSPPRRWSAERRSLSFAIRTTAGATLFATSCPPTPGVITAAVKQGTTPELCAGMDQESAHREIERKVAEAIEKARTGALRPYKPALPMTVTVQMRTIDGAAKAAQKPGVLRIDDHIIEARVGRQCDVIQWLTGSGLDMPAG